MGIACSRSSRIAKCARRVSGASPWSAISRASPGARKRRRLHPRASITPRRARPFTGSIPHGRARNSAHSEAGRLGGAGVESTADRGIALFGRVRAASARVRDRLRSREAPAHGSQRDQKIFWGDWAARGAFRQSPGVRFREPEGPPAVVLLCAGSRASEARADACNARRVIRAGAKGWLGGVRLRHLCVLWTSLFEVNEVIQVKK